MTTPTPTAIHGTRDDLLWLAGLLEGEGTFDAHRGRYPRIRLGMTDRDVVGRAASLMGAEFRSSLRRPPASATWHTEVSGERAVAIMREVLPFMGARRSAAIVNALGAGHFARTAAGSSTPGPRVQRPAGIAKPAVAA